MNLQNGNMANWTKEEKARQALLEVGAAKSLKVSQDAVWERTHPEEAAKEKKQADIATAKSPVVL
jgi:hypothetical protein